MTKEEGFKEETEPQKKGRKITYIKKIIEEDSFRIPHLNLILVTGMICFIVGMGIAFYIYGNLPKSYVQDIVDNGMRVCYIDKCFYWSNCTRIELMGIEGKLVQTCRQECPTSIISIINKTSEKK